VFGFSFGELVVLVIVAIVVIGPKDLPKVLRRLGQWSGKIRRMAADLRQQSGIDDVLRTEGLAESVQEIRKLARGELGDIERSIKYDGSEAKLEARAVEVRAMRDREYPRDGADAYGALPDTALVYTDTLPKNELAKSPLYVLGDKDGVIPEEPKKEDADADAEASADANADADAKADGEVKTLLGMPAPSIETATTTSTSTSTATEEAEAHAEEEKEAALRTGST
jgi:sec-independent protein translocase protein TatB